MLVQETSMQVFDFDRSPVRVLQDEKGDPWFVAKDVAELLGYSNPQKAIRDHCKNASPIGVNDSFTLHPQTVIIPERDVYRLIMKSKLPAAERFEEWVVGEVLPSIRKTGSYNPTSHMSMIDMMMAQLQVMKANEARIEKVESSIDQVKDDIKHIQHARETRPEYFTIAGYANYVGTAINLKMASSIGRKASQYCKTHGIPMDEIPDPRFGYVKMYPKYVLEKIFGEPMF